MDVALVADRNNVPGVIRAAMMRPDSDKKADDYIRLMQGEEPLSKPWHQLREKAIFAALPMLVHMRKRLPPLPPEPNIDLYMTGVESVVKSLTPNDAGKTRYDAARSSFYTFHRKYGAYITMRDQHVRLCMTASMSDNDVNNVLAKSLPKKAKARAERSFEDARAFFRNRQTYSLSAPEDDDEGMSFHQRLEHAISQPDTSLLSVATLYDVTNLSVKWRIGIDEAIGRFSKESRTFCMDAPLFRSLTGYYDIPLPPRTIDEVAEIYGLTRQGATLAVGRVFTRLATTLKVEEERLRSIVEALVDYELAERGIDASDVPRSLLKPVNAGY